MKKKAIAGVIASGVVLMAVVGHANQPKPANTTPQTNKNNPTAPASNPTAKIKPTIPTCDGTTTTSGCVVEGVKYKTYINHAAVPEKSHTEQTTSYEKKITSYCTLCNDGTYSPSCATGSGTCSHHNGVAQWNAPRYADVPVYGTKTVVDAPAQAAYIEKVTE